MDVECQWVVDDLRVRGIYRRIQYTQQDIAIITISIFTYIVHIDVHNKLFLELNVLTIKIASGYNFSCDHVLLNTHAGNFQFKSYIVWLQR